MLGLPLAVNAQETEEPILSITGNFPCEDFDKMRMKLREDHNEIPFVSAQGATRLLNLQTQSLGMAQHNLYLFANPDTYEYTLVFTLNAYGKEVGCILSAGNNLGPVLQDGI